MSDTGLPWWGRTYVSVVAIVGIAVLAHSVYSLYTVPIGWNWFVLALLTLVTGSATVRLPSVPATISISETFVFTSALLYGPAAGTLTVALDALAISFSLARKGHPAYRLVFNIFALPLSIWIGAHLFFAIANLQPLATLPTTAVDIGDLLKPLFAFTACYFALNSWLIAFAIAIEKRLSPFSVWRHNFAWLSLNYFGGASVAALLVTYTRDIDYRFLAIVLPLLAVLYFTFSTSMGRVEDTNKHLRALNSLYMSTIETLAMAIDAKDQITHGHIRRVQHYAVQLAKDIGITDPSQIRAIEAASLLHDMGKLAVPEYILNKPGPLTPSEFEKMKLHASVGADILSAIEFPYPVVPIVRHHHENWNGTGYPDGLGGTDIPIGARILSVVDCFDALTSDRPYRPRLSDADAIKILVERRGTMYDPLVVDTFINVSAVVQPSESADTTSARAGLSAIARSMTSADPASKQRLDEINASTEETIEMYHLARSLSGVQDAAKSSELILKHLRRLVPISTCVVYLFDDKNDELVVETAAGEHSGHFIGMRIPRGQRLSGWVAANLQSVRNSDPILDLGDAGRTLRPALRSCLAAPIAVDSNLVGVLSIYSTRSSAFNDDHERITESVARLIAPTLRASAIDRVATASVTSEPAAQRPAGVAIETVGGIEAVLVVELRLANTSFPPPDRVETEVTALLREVLQPGSVVLTFNPTTLVVILGTNDRDAVQQLFHLATRQLAEVRLGRLPGVMAVKVGFATSPENGATLELLLNSARHSAVTVVPFNSPRSIH